ncbi:31319_t:CDS:1, partial [Racocetra persica]
FTESLKSKIEKYNQNSENFIFCVGDLEEQEECKFDIHSPELRQQLWAIITSNGGTMPSPTGIKFSEFPSELKT